MHGLIIVKPQCLPGFGLRLAMIVHLDLRQGRAPRRNEGRNIEPQLASTLAPPSSLSRPCGWIHRHPRPLNTNQDYGRCEAAPPPISPFVAATPGGRLQPGPLRLHMATQLQSILHGKVAAAAADSLVHGGLDFTVLGGRLDRLEDLTAHTKCELKT